MYHPTLRPRGDAALCRVFYESWQRSVLDSLCRKLLVPTGDQNNEAVPLPPPAPGAADRRSTMGIKRVWECNMCHRQDLAQYGPPENAYMWRGTLRSNYDSTLFVPVHGESDDRIDLLKCPDCVMRERLVDMLERDMLERLEQRQQNDSSQT